MNATLGFLTSSLLIAFFAYQPSVVLAKKQISPHLHNISRILLDIEGDSDDADRFRILLAEYLEAEAFVIVDSIEDSDATLTGIYSVRMKRGTEKATATLRLLLPSGENVWSFEYSPRTSSSRTAHYTASAAAKQLRKDSKRSEKNARKPNG